MFKKIKEKLLRKEFTGIINLPTDGLSSVVKHYGNLAGANVPMVLVVIYNTEQLAKEIAKALKDSANNCSSGNDNSK